MSGYVAYDVGDSDAMVPVAPVVTAGLDPDLQERRGANLKSLYPSIMRTFCIDPLGLWAPGDEPVPGFLGAEFARQRHFTRFGRRLVGDTRQRRATPMSQAIKSHERVSACFNGCRFTTHDWHRASLVEAKFSNVRRPLWRISYRSSTVTPIHCLLPRRKPGRRHTRRRSTRPAANAWWRQTIEQEFGVVSYPRWNSRPCLFTLSCQHFEVQTKAARNATWDDRATGQKTRAGFEPGDRAHRLTPWHNSTRIIPRVFANQPVDDVKQIVQALEVRLDDKLVTANVFAAMSTNTGQYTTACTSRPTCRNFLGWVEYVITAVGPKL